MFKAIVFCAMAAFSQVPCAADFAGQYGGYQEGKVELNGKLYPLKADISAEYRGQLVSISLVPAGVRVSYVLENVDGIGTIVQIGITETSAELDALFPPR